MPAGRSHRRLRPHERLAAIRRLLEALCAGENLETACVHAGVSSATMYRWRADPELDRQVRAAIAGELDLDGLDPERDLTFKEKP